MAANWIYFIFILMFLTLESKICATLPTDIIYTKSGAVQGFTDEVLGRKVNRYLGIPYAKPPVGERRFRAPEPVSQWSGVLEATRLPNSCWQPMDTTFGDFYGTTMWNANTKLDEDCLYLSVWVPKTNYSLKKKAVLVFIYGGSFSSGSHTLDIYDPSYLTTLNDVIFVGIQYRVGALGFFALDIEDAPGNAGLWDQKLALQWVHDNIELFGGDHKRVTLVGESAGAASVGFHLLNGRHEDLFQGAILQSGAPEAHWGALNKKEILKRSLSLAKIFSCPYSSVDSSATVNCMRQKNGSEFRHMEYKTSDGTMQFAFAPIVDGKFLEKTPQEMVRDKMFKKVPLLLGSNANEATFFLAYETKYFKYDEEESLINHENYKKLLRQFFRYYPTFPNNFSNFGHDAVYFHYHNWINHDDAVKNRQSLDSALSDASFVCAVNSLARAYSMHELPVYYYWFDQRWTANPWAKWMGVLHGDEFWFSFGQALNESHSFSEAEKQLSRSMMKFWTNFAKTGDPNKADDGTFTNAWPRFRHNEQLYVKLSTSSLQKGYVVDQGPRAHSCAFWDHYLPSLMHKTDEMVKTQDEWKQTFNSWKSKYLTEWKNDFDAFIQKSRQQTKSCRVAATNTND